MCANNMASSPARESVLQQIFKYYSREDFMLLEGKNITLQAAEGSDLMCGTI